MNPKSVHQNTIIGQRGVNLVERRVLDMGHVWNATTIDAGIDGVIELRKPDGVATNLVIQAQVKTTSGDLPSETAESFRWPVSARDVSYWLGGNAPVVLFVVHLGSESVYWVDVKSYFAAPSRAKDKSIRFSKSGNRFDGSSSDSLSRVASPLGLGVYLGPPPKEETLVSNLLEVTGFSPTIYVGQSKCDKAGAIWPILNEVFDEAPGEWFLKGSQILSFVDLDVAGWSDVVEAGTVDSIESAHFAQSDDPDLRRDFVRLMNRSLRARLWGVGVGWSKEHHCFYFIRNRRRKRPDRTFNYRSTKQRSTRDVVKCYRRDDGSFRFCRHSALEASFLRDRSRWFLELVPTYHFTRDGKERDGFRDQHLKKIKEFEHNRAVRGQVVMWASVLTDVDDALGLGYPHLRFGELQTFDLEVGIDEETWTGREVPKTPPDDTLPLLDS